MKLLVLTNLYPPHYIGGYELICQMVVESLRERGHAVAVLTSDFHQAELRAEAPEHQVERSLRLHGLYGHQWLGIWPLRSLEFHNNAVLQRALARERPDLIYIWNMGGLSKSLLLTLQRLGVPRAFYVSDHWIRRGLAGDVWLSWWNRRDLGMMARALRHAWTRSGYHRRWDREAPTEPISAIEFPRLTFCSRALREATAAAGFAVGHGEIVYSPINKHYLNEAPTTPTPTVRRLLYVGRLEEDKGVMTALRALDLLQGKLDVQLSVYGRGESDYVQRLKAFVRERNLPVRFDSAPLEEMPAVYRSHDLLLFPSEWPEPFALTPLEAMACGLPVIGTMTGGSAELFRDGVNALTFQAGRAEDLAGCIWELATRHSLRVQLAETAAREARERYALPVIVDQLETYLQESLTPRTRGPRFLSCAS